MIQAIGMDLIELNRIEQIGIERLADRILSDDEKIRFESINNQQTKLSFLGGRFAAKEALFKCFKTGEGKTNYKDFSILNEPSGNPYVESVYTKAYKVFISITHTDNYAACMIVLEK